MPAWNLTLVKELFPEKLVALIKVYNFPEISKSKYNYTNYTKYEMEWFKPLQRIRDLFGERGAFAYHGK